jgi:hypothetical protein
VKKHWTIEIIETDDVITAKITRKGTEKSLLLNVEKSLYPDLDEVIGELFCGSLPNIRDSFDTI